MGCDGGRRRLLQFPGVTGRPAHIVFYEDLKKNPTAVWERLQKAVTDATPS